jgi:hypothetical protein
MTTLKAMNNHQERVNAGSAGILACLERVSAKRKFR